MLKCREATRLLSDAQERELEFKEKLSLQVHLMMCSACRNFGEHMKALRQITHTYVRGTKAADEEISNIPPD